MFTPYMNNEELQAEAYRDYLEMRTKIQVAFGYFLSRLRLLSRQKTRFLHSLVEEKKITTKAKNTWHILFVNPDYSPNNQFTAGCIIYIPLYRGDEVDYLFINNVDNFVLEKLSAHFIARYKERYIDYNGINLRGRSPAVYFLTHNQGRSLTYYMPEKWTKEDLKHKSFMISQQGLLLTSTHKELITYITFLDQENLSRYKAQVYEEEAMWKDMERLSAQNSTFENRQALYMKYCSDLDKTKRILERHIRRICKKEEDVEEAIETVMKFWDDIAEKTMDIDRMQKEQKAAEAKPRNLLDVGVDIFENLRKRK